MCKDHAVDEKELAEEVEKAVERELKVRMKVQISTPGTDARSQEPVIDLSKVIDMDIDIE